MKINKFNKTLIILVAVSGVILLVLLYFTMKNKNSDHGEKQAYEKNPLRVFRSEEYENELMNGIRWDEIPEFFRTRRLYHQYERKKNPDNEVRLEIEQKFQGEKGKLVSDVYQTYTIYLEETEKIDRDSSIDLYQKILQKRKLAVSLFGKDFSKVLFPIRDKDKIQEFFAYAERYLKKHKYDDPYSIQDHLVKARKEIYGSAFEDLRVREDRNDLLELEKRIHWKEWELMTKKEQENWLNKINRDLITQ